VVRDISIAVPKPQTGGGGSGGGSAINADIPASVNGTAFAHLVTRSATYHLLSSLPPDARLQMVQVKSTVAATDTTVTITWDSKTRLASQAVMEAFEFLDKQVEGGEWSLRFKHLHFATGKSLLQWQVDTSSKIELSQVTQ